MGRIMGKFFGKNASKEEETNPYARQQTPEVAPPVQQTRQNPAGGLPNGPKSGLPAAFRHGPGPGPSPRPPTQNSGYGADKYGTPGGYGANVYGNGPGREGMPHNAGNRPQLGRADSRAHSFNTATTLVDQEDDDRRSDLLGGSQRRFDQMKLQDDDDETDRGRNELFGGARERYNQKGPETSSAPPADDGDDDGYDGYGSRRDLTPEELMEKALQAEKQKIKQTREETAQMSDEMVRLAHEARNTTTGILQRFGEQNQSLHRTNDHLSRAEEKAKFAVEQSRELKTLNRSMFAVHVSNPFGKADRQRQREELVAGEHQQLSEKRAKDRLEAYQDEKRIGKAINDLQVGYERKPVKRDDEERKKYLFEEDDSDIEKEDRIDDNSDETAFVVGQMKQAALFLDKALTKEAPVLDKLAPLATNASSRLGVANDTFGRIR